MPPVVFSFEIRQQDTTPEHAAASASNSLWRTHACKSGRQPSPEWSSLWPGPDHTCRAGYSRYLRHGKGLSPIHLPGFSLTPSPHLSTILAILYLQLRRSHCVGTWIPSRPATRHDIPPASLALSARLRARDTCPDPRSSASFLRPTLLCACSVRRRRRGRSPGHRSSTRAADHLCFQVRGLCPCSLAIQALFQSRD